MKRMTNDNTRRPTVKRKPIAVLGRQAMKAAVGGAHSTGARVERSCSFGDSRRCLGA